MDKTNPNQCIAMFNHTKDSDSGTWDILTTLCNRGRGKNYDKAIVLAQRGIAFLLILIDIEFVQINHFIMRQQRQ